MSVGEGGFIAVSLDASVVQPQQALLPVSAARNHLLQSGAHFLQNFLQRVPAFTRLPTIGFPRRAKMSREVDALVGLNLLVPNAEEWILAVCRKRLSEPGTDCIR